MLEEHVHGCESPEIEEEMGQENTPVSGRAI